MEIEEFNYILTHASDDFFYWAFGPDFKRSDKIHTGYKKWNKLHSDITIIDGKDNYEECFIMMYKEYENFIFDPIESRFEILDL